MTKPPAKNRNGRLLAEERRRAILELLQRNGRITVDEMVAHFGVSAVTVRGDLDALAALGSLVRSHGGAVKPLVVAPDYPLQARAAMHRAEKIRIAQGAVRLIRPFQTVILCSGSTSLETAAQLRQARPESITVITHALNIARQLADLPDLSLLMVGGIFRQVSSAFVGPQAEFMMRSLHADHCFLSTVGVDLSAGFTTLDIMEAQLNRCMIEASAEVTVLADSSKFGHKSLSSIAPIERVRRVITDSNVDPVHVRRLQDLGLEVMAV